MKKRHIILIILWTIIIGVPLLLRFSWELTPKKPFNVLFVNKSVTDSVSLTSYATNWVLTHRKYVKPGGSFYDPLEDYIGFFPKEGRNFRVRDLNDKNEETFHQLAKDLNMVYFADTYGVYAHQWHKNDDKVLPYHKIYGGLSERDLDLIENMIANDKMVIAEFNFLTSPSPRVLQERAEQIFNLRWQGWNGRFMPTLNKADTDRVPAWLIDLYEAQNNSDWKFTESGIMLVNENEKVVILEYPKHLQTPVPEITTTFQHRKNYGIPNRIAYPGWFEVTFPRSRAMEVISWFEIPVNEAGKAVLEKNNIPDKFPAAFRGINHPRKFYFAGDFGKTEVPQRFVRFKGSRYLELFLTDLRDPTNREGFFFAYYLPLFSSILKEEYELNQDF